MRIYGNYAARLKIKVMSPDLNYVIGNMKKVSIVLIVSALLGSTLAASFV